MNYVILLSSIHKTFKAERKLQTFLCSLWERSDIANSQTRHSESFFGTASVVVKLPINKDRSVFELHQLYMWSLYIWCISKPVKSFNLLSRSTSSNRGACYWAIHSMQILKLGFYAGNENQRNNSANAAFIHTQLISMSRYDKRKNCTVYLEFQLAFFIKTSSFCTICEEPSLRRLLRTEFWLS